MDKETSMGIMSRTLLALRIKSNAALDRAEDPVETLNYAETQQRNLIQVVGRGLIDVASARQQLIRQADRLRAQIPLLEERARLALEADREDLARIALERKQVAIGELAELGRQVEELEAEERKLTTAHQQLSSRVEEFRVRRVSTIAQHAAAESRVKVNEAITGVSGELAELSMAVGRAEERTERLQARATAIDVLIASGSISEPIGGVDRVERELQAISTSRAVETELLALKAGLEGDD
jgi:phage shock protein A